MKKRKNRSRKSIDKVIVVNITPKKRNIRILDLEEGDCNSKEDKEPPRDDKADS